MEPLAADKEMELGDKLNTGSLGMTLNDTVDERVTPSFVVIVTTK
jgi:hypothetical protein